MEPRLAQEPCRVQQVLADGVLLVVEGGVTSANRGSALGTTAPEALTGPQTTSMVVDQRAGQRPVPTEELSRVQLSFPGSDCERLLREALRCGEAMGSDRTSWQALDGVEGEKEKHQALTHCDS